MGRRGLLRKCTACGRYTLREDACPHCGAPVRSPHPPKFSPDDPYGEYRRRMKKETLLANDP